MTNKKEKTITLELKVCLEGEKQCLSTIPTAPKVANLDLYLNSVTPTYLPVLDLGPIEIPLKVFDAGYETGVKALEKALADYLTPTIAERIRKLK